MTQAIFTSPYRTFVNVLLGSAIATGAGTAIAGMSGTKTYQANGTTSAGSGAATILIQGSIDGVNWDTIGTITLTLATTTASDSFTSNDRYPFVRANVTSLSGTGASVTASQGF